MIGAKVKRVNEPVKAHTGVLAKVLLDIFGLSEVDFSYFSPGFFLRLEPCHFLRYQKWCPGHKWVPMSSRVPFVKPRLCGQLW